MPATHQLTRLLIEWSDGREGAFDELVPLVYDELRVIARRRVHRERAGHTLQATDLVHEAFISLHQRKSVQLENRSQFLAAASRVMRNLLVDHARRAKAQKRDVVKVPIDEAFPEHGGAAGQAGGASAQPAHEVRGLYLEVKSHPAELLDLDRALNKLEEDDPEGVTIFELHYFGGYTHAEVATLRDIGERTVRRRIAGMRRRLGREIDLGKTAE